MIATRLLRQSHRRRRRPAPAVEIQLLESRALLSASNVLVNDPAADLTSHDTQSETTMVLGADNRIIVAFNDTGSLVDGTTVTGYAVSTDDGESFQDLGAPPSPPAGGGDPSLAYSAKTGTVFLATFALNFQTFLQSEQINVYRSTDNGLTFQPPVNAAPGFVDGVDLQDKDWIAVDNTPGPGYGNVYLVWRDISFNPLNNGILLTRSTDDGLTWGPDGGVKIATPGQNGHNRLDPEGAWVTVGPDHTVYVFWLDNSGIQMRKSTDQGLTFGNTFLVTGLKTHGDLGDLGLTDAGGRSFQTNGYPQAAVNPATGDLYVVFNDQPNGSADKGDVFFTYSTDGGKHWSKPVRVNDDATGNDQWQPALAVTPDGGHVGVFWYDRRLDPANNLIDRFGAIGGVSGHDVSFGANFRITDASFAPAFGQDPPLPPRNMGDYDVAVADNSFFYVTWGDNRLGDDFHASQPDVRFSRIPVPAMPAGSTAIVVEQNPGISEIPGFYEFQTPGGSTMPMLSPGTPLYSPAAIATPSAFPGTVGVAIDSAIPAPPNPVGDDEVDRDSEDGATQSTFPADVAAYFEIADADEWDRLTLLQAAISLSWSV
jgi:hypothetical protein